MRNKKMSIDEFKKLKQKMQELITKTDINNIDENNSFVQKYIKLQNKLLSHNLSNISFKAWKNLVIISTDDHIADFSKTNAQLDFKYLKVIGFANYKNCKTKNIKYLGQNLNPNSFDKNTISKNSKTFLSNDFSDDFKEKFYNNSVKIGDLNNLFSYQLKEAIKKNIYLHLDYTEFSKNLFKVIGLHKMMEFYKVAKYHEKSFKMVNNLFDAIILYKTNNPLMFTNLKLKLLREDVYSYTEICLNYLKEYSNTPNNNCADILIHSLDGMKKISDILGYDYFKELVKEHFDFIEHVLVGENLDEFVSYFRYQSNPKTMFFEAVKEYFDSYLRNRGYASGVGDKFPKYMKSFDLKIIDGYSSWEYMQTYDDHTYLNDRYQRILIRYLGIENMKRFDEETGFFSLLDENVLFRNVYFWQSIILMVFDHITYFKNNKDNILNYEDFLNVMAEFIEYFRNASDFSHVFNYDCIKGSFRDNHPELFINIDAPQDLKDAFYKNIITLDNLNKHKEWIPYLVDKNIKKSLYCFRKYIYSGVSPLSLYLPYHKNDKTTKEINFIDFFCEKYSNEELLNLLAKYGELCSQIDNGFFSSLIIYENDSKEDIENKIKEAIYKRLIYNDENICFRYLLEIEDFVKKYPDIFIDLSTTSLLEEEKEDVLNAFYNKNMSYEYVKNYPILKELLINKNISVPFNIHDEDEELLKHIGTKYFLELCSIYGNYFEGVFDDLQDYISNEYDRLPKDLEDFEDLKRQIEKIIVKRCFDGEYTYLKDNAPDFLLKNYPKLFLSDDAPEELKNLFYAETFSGLTFNSLHENPEWIPYLEDKEVLPALLKETDNKEQMKLYFELFGNKALKFGIQKTETIQTMIDSNKVELMKKWYDKTGGKFIPDVVIMQNFSLKDADKFLNAINYWSKLMKIESFANNLESREAMLKLAYSFGVFDNDQRGFQKLYTLLTDIPHHVKPQYYIKFKDFEYYNEQKLLQDTLINENYIIDNKHDLQFYVYRENQDNSFTLTINPQKHPKSVKVLRGMLEKRNCKLIIYPDLAHKLFGGFKLEYDKRFKEFLLQNLEVICVEEITKISNIQRQFREIKVINSNRALTLDLALQYVESNKYENVDVGNDRMAEISAIAGYNQEDFDTLQQIYNYGKTRTFSSIPRIENKTDKYSYEILRLDDPLALAIGTLTDCCQEINNMAEACMAHSVIDQNGRVFVIRDNAGNIVAQSWVWRNKNVLCFDNIEVPDKALERKENVVNDIYKIYVKASKELIDEDERIYKDLLDKGKITKEQYNCLCLNKITVGLGYNDIASVIRSEAKQDNEKTKPLSFKSPIVLNHGLYTSDSKIQYVLKERKDRNLPYNGDTLAVHYDTYKIYDNSNFTMKDLFLLANLEDVTKDYDFKINLEDFNNDKELVTDIAKLYNLNPVNTRIILHPNFAIIYEIKDNEIVIGDLFFNSIVIVLEQELDITKDIIIQIYLAINQISKDKKINFDSLNDSQKEMLNKALNLDDKFDNLKSKR